MVTRNRLIQAEAERHPDDKVPSRWQVRQLLRQRHTLPFRPSWLHAVFLIVWLMGGFMTFAASYPEPFQSDGKILHYLLTVPLGWLHFGLWFDVRENWLWLSQQSDPLGIWLAICYGTLLLWWLGWRLLMLRPDTPARTLRWHQERAALSRGQLTEKEALQRFTLKEAGLPLAQLSISSVAHAPVTDIPKQIVLGVPRRQLEGHALVLAPTRSGKSMHLTDTLLSYDRAMVVVDPKAEQYERTAGYRARHVGPVYRIPGHTLDLARYFDLRNPVDVLALHRHMMQPWKDGKNRAFADKAKHLFEASARYAAHHHLHPLRVLFDVARSVPQAALTALATVDPNNVYSFTNGQPPDEGLDRYAASAWGVFHDRFYPYQSHWWTLTQRSDMTGIPADWAEQRATIYITWPMTQLADVAGAIEAMIAALLRDKIAHNNKTPALIAIDEMPHIGIEELPTWLAQVGGYGVTLLLYAQTWSQLVEVYGHNNANTILSNCQYQLWYPSADLGTAQYMSKLYGNHLTPYNRYGNSLSRERLEFDPGKRAYSLVMNVQQEPRLDPRQMMSLPRDTVLLQMGREAVTLAKRLWPVERFAKLPTTPAIILASEPTRPQPSWDTSTAASETTHHAESSNDAATATRATRRRSQDL